MGNPYYIYRFNYHIFSGGTILPINHQKNIIQTSMPYCSMHMSIGWNELSMPNAGCSVHIPIIITNSKLRCVEQILFPYMMKVILTHIYVECWIVDPYVYRLFNGSG